WWRPRGSCAGWVERNAKPISSLSAGSGVDRSPRGSRFALLMPHPLAISRGQSAPDTLWLYGSSQLGDRGGNGRMFQSKAARERALLKSSASAADKGAARRFHVVLVKPSHYDDDGYVIRWYRSPMPSNSLASVYGLLADCAERKILGDDVAGAITAIDETNKRVPVDEIIADFRRNGNFGFVGLVGVQSNQYPRALDIARPLRAARIQVVIGGFHVSGLLAMFPDLMPDLKVALDMG